MSDIGKMYAIASSVAAGNGGGGGGENIPTIEYGEEGEEFFNNVFSPLLQTMNFQILYNGLLFKVYDVYPDALDNYYIFVKLGGGGEYRFIFGGEYSTNPYKWISVPALDPVPAIGTFARPLYYGTSEEPYLPGADYYYTLSNEEKANNIKIILFKGALYVVKNITKNGDAISFESFINDESGENVKTFTATLQNYSVVWSVN